MKKFILAIFMILSLTLVNIIGVSAATIYDDFDFTVYDNKKYDLITGLIYDDELYSITNKIHIDKDLIGNEVIFSNVSFHHVLFFNSYNAYIGYVNTNKTDLQLSTWIDGDVNIDGSLNIPAGVDKIALMNYNYDEFRDNIIYENENIDNIAWDNLSYRDIFEGTDLVVNGDFNNFTLTTVNTLNLFDIDSTISIPEYTFTQLDVDSFKVVFTGDATTYSPFGNNITYNTNTQYTISGYVWEDLGGDWDALSIYYTDFSTDVVIIPNTTRTYFTWTSDIDKTIDFLTIVKFGSEIDSTYFDELQIEKGTTASDYIAYEVDTNLPNTWIVGGNIYLPTVDVIDEQLHFTGVGSPSSYNNTIALDVPNTDTRDHVMYYGYDAYAVNVQPFMYASFDKLYRIDWDVLTDTMTSFSKINTMPSSGVNFFQLAAYLDLEVVVDNVIRYDLTEIFTTNLPDIDEFETMKLYYDTYINAVDEISYNDIYANNLIVNGDFSENLTGWSTDGNSTVVIENERLKQIGLSIDASSMYPSYSLSMDSGHIGYISLDYEIDSLLINNFISRLYTVIPHNSYLDYSNGLHNSSYLFEVTSNASMYFISYYPSNSNLSNEIIYFDNLRVFDLTAIFGYVEDEINADWIGLHYLTWLDPFGDAYSFYYPAANLITLDIDYSYDDTPAPPPDAIGSIDDGLVKMGVVTDELKVFLAFAIMIIVAIFVGFKTHNSTFIILAEVVLIIIFTMLGWFSFWILLLMALIFTLLILRAGLKGGNNQ